MKMPASSPTTEEVLASLRRAVSKALDRKRRLGQYTVVWKDGRVQRIEPDAMRTAVIREEK